MDFHDQTSDIAPADAAGEGVDRWWDGQDGKSLLHEAIRRRFVGRIAVVSSFGAESAVLLALVAEIDRAVPVLFLDTGRHFAETLAYRDRLAAHLGLRDVRNVRPDPAALAEIDPFGALATDDPDLCCGVRKVAPLDAALAPYAAWVSGRKRHQSDTRAKLPLIEISDGRAKINPLADWSAARLMEEIRRRGLPPHPLVAQGYRSIGCAPCTQAVRPGQDARAGRWAGTGKTECGIHLGAGGRYAPTGISPAGP